MTDGRLQSQESPSALGGATAAEQHLPLHAAHLVVVVPRQLRAGPNPPARGRRGGKVSDRYATFKPHSRHSGFEAAAGNKSKHYSEWIVSQAAQN